MAQLWQVVLLSVPVPPNFDWKTSFLKAIGEDFKKKLNFENIHGKQEYKAVRHPKKDQESPSEHKAIFCCTSKSKIELQSYLLLPQ